MKFIFIGNRRFVLEEMIRLNLNIEKVFVIKNSHLEKDVKELDIHYTIISSKKELLNNLEKLNFEILISNGCPYILPINQMDQTKKYINIHPSFLPDLKGVDPVIGSILFKRDAGATCHIMNEEIDGGDIISQVKIPYSDDLDVSLLYQLSFIAEKECFIDALRKNFEPYIKQNKNKKYLYYKRNEKDKLIDLKNDSVDTIISKIKAFNNKSQGAYFIFENQIIKVYDVDFLTNDYVVNYSKNFNELEIIFLYENCIVFKKDNKILKFKNIIGDISKFSTGKSLTKG